MSAVGVFPWQRVMQWGLRDLRLSPDQFWRSTLRELFPQHHTPPGVELRRTLDEMMKTWPDDGRCEDT